MTKASEIGIRIDDIGDIKVFTEGDDVPGFGWKLSEETHRALEEIDKNLRQAAAMLSTTIVGTTAKIGCGAGIRLEEAIS